MRLTTWTLLVFLLCALIPTTLTQANEDACSSRDVAYPVVKISILDEPSYHGARVRYAAPRERLDIIGTKHFGAWCWLQVRDGWLIDNPRALSAEPYLRTFDQPKYVPGCYPADKAYVFGDMNIRTDPSTRSRIVANARAGDVFVVLGSQVGTDWCWLKVNQGWLAKTARVSSTTLRIAGSSEFVRQVESALIWMENMAAEWHNYVIDGVDKIFEFTDSDPGSCTAYAYSEQRRVGLETCFSNGFQKKGLSARLDQLEIAVFLAHEACHVHRHEAGFVYDASTRDYEEEECKKPMYGVKVALDPFERYGTLTVDGETVFRVVERFCSEGFSPELYCPIIERLLGG